MRCRALALLALLAFAGTAAEATRATLRASRPGAPPLVLQAVAVGDRWTILVQEGGVEAQRIEVESDLPEVRPRLADANGDRAADLWVPVIGGNVNTAWDLWLMRPEEARFRRAGELSGLGFSRDGAGRLVALARDGCCAMSYLFHDFDAEGRLRELFAIERRLDTPGRGACTGQPIAIAPPASALRETCALTAGALPGRRLAVP
ncbi:hypothetical protein GXW77_04140 [Roseomonas alkaliterrae]|uniref:VCBS repeat-containing protein n=1 Tax=Neoroseomonas alkaliterrae TaxID=1452450 RepID=A0A840XR63_9PROT|nr:hypothetical protein [Neoroseomonas alkaliterrae]MBB5689169.1 hypothetical protein [Neoroseomonas alkaliterrae]MBR0675360.1 hypothetical protein [Neoroseomonas alkaliterrae]